MWLPDTNFWIDILKRPASPAAARFRMCHASHLKTSSIVWAELLHGARKYALSSQRRETIRMMLAPFECLPVDVEVAECYGRLRDELERKGLVIGPFDLLIAATAVAHGLTVITRNTAEYSRIPDLMLEDWSGEVTA